MSKHNWAESLSFFKVIYTTSRGIKNRNGLKIEDYLKNEDKLKNQDNLKNKDDFKNEEDLNNTVSSMCSAWSS